MRRLVLASYDKIMLNINAVVMLQKKGEPAFSSYLLPPHNELGGVA